jgi:putative ABC transport system substrate-binding protein
MFNLAMGAFFSTRWFHLLVDPMLWQPTVLTFGGVVCTLRVGQCSAPPSTRFGKTLLVRRRNFMTLLTAGTVAWPFTLSAQHRSPVRLGFLPLGSHTNAYDLSLVDAFRTGLRQAGLVENIDIVLEILWTKGDPDQDVRELLNLGVQLLVPCGSSASVAARQQAPELPIVFLSVGDPVAMGLADSLPRPGRNATGFTDLLADLSAKLVDFATELSKPQGTVEYLWYTTWPDGHNRYQSAKGAAEVAGMRLSSREVRNISEVESVFAAIRQGGSRIVIVQPSPFTYGQRGRILDVAAKNKVGTIFAFPIAAREGSLIAYGPDYLHMYRRAPFYVDRVLKGAKPADLPIQLPTKVELLVNLKTAKLLELETPLSLLVRADELIE